MLHAVSPRVVVVSVALSAGCSHGYSGGLFDGGIQDGTQDGAASSSTPGALARDGGKASSDSGDASVSAYTASTVCAADIKMTELCEIEVGTPSPTGGLLPDGIYDKVHTLAFFAPLDKTCTAATLFLDHGLWRSQIQTTAPGLVAALAGGTFTIDPDAARIDFAVECQNRPSGAGGAYRYSWAPKTNELTLFQSSNGAVAKYVRRDGS